MKIYVFIFLASLSLQSAEAQFFNAIRNLFGGGAGGGGGGFNLFGGNRFRDDGTQAPVSTGVDKLFPDDCGRNTQTGRGKLCFPDGQLCADRKYSFRTYFYLVLLKSQISWQHWLQQW